MLPCLDLITPVFCLQHCRYHKYHHRLERKIHSLPYPTRSATVYGGGKVFTVLLISLLTLISFSPNQMENALCDELLQEIFQKLPPSSSSSVSLVCKRWLYLYRTSRTSLSLQLTPNLSVIPFLTSFLTRYPSLFSLSLVLSSDPTTSSFSDLVLSAVSSCCSRLRGLRFLAGPVSHSSLISLSSACTRLTSLSINLTRPIFLKWVLSFPNLQDLTITLCSDDRLNQEIELKNQYGVWESDDSDAELNLESLCLVGIRADDWGVDWLWRSCKKLKKLQLQDCQGIGAYSSFVQCLQGVEEVELRTCRSIVDGVLLKLAENCHSLNSLLVYDGGSREGLLNFFSQSRCNLQKLDLRLPLDLNNKHLLALSTNLRGISSLRLQNCCLVTGEGLKALGMAMNSGLEELALINCDVVEREPGLLATLGQHLRQLRKLDLSHNEMLLDKEFISMLASCTYLIDLKLRGCRGLTSAALVSMVRSCKRLENVDIMHCGGIESEAVELFLKNSPPRLRRMKVEESKLSDAAKMWASNKFIEVVV